MVHEETLERSAQLAQAHQKDAFAHTELVSSLHSSLESLLQGDMVRLFQDVGTFDTLLVSAF